MLVMRNLNGFSHGLLGETFSMRIPNLEQPDQVHLHLLCSENFYRKHFFQTSNRYLKVHQLV